MFVDSLFFSAGGIDVLSAWSAASFGTRRIGAGTCRSLILDALSDILIPRHFHAATEAYYMAVKTMLEEALGLEKLTPQ